MTLGAFLHTLKDVRLCGTATAIAHFFWWRDMSGTIVGGLRVFLPLELGMGW